MSKPTLIFTPGAWHGPEIYDETISKLSPLGYKCIALSLQAVVQNPPVKDLQPDISAVREVVTNEAEAGRDIMMVVHSFSGLIVNGALDGLSKAEREKEGKKGGVVKLAFLSAFCRPEQVSLMGPLGVPSLDWYDIKGPWVTVKDAEAVFYHDLSPDQASYCASKLRPHSWATLWAGASSAAWRTIPSTYLICEDDRAIPLSVQEEMVKLCQDAGAPMDTERIFASHSPFFSKPNEVVGFLRRAAGETQL